MTDIEISDSIKNVLVHFEEALKETLIRIDFSPKELNETPQIEGIETFKYKVSALCRSLLWPIEAEKKSNTSVFQVWPTFGCFEVLLWRKSSTIVFMHDPVPLRKQIGFSAPAKFLARVPFLVG